MFETISSDTFLEQDKAPILLIITKIVNSKPMRFICDENDTDKNNSTLMITDKILFPIILGEKIHGYSSDISSIKGNT